MAALLPDRARVVIVGGGVIGCSIAYHLAHLGWGDEVVLLERDRLTSGTTWHAAGLMTTFGSTSETNTGIRLYSRDLFARLEAETGQATGFRPVGLIEAAADEERLHEYRRVAAFQRRLGLEVHEISPAEIEERFPWARTDDLLAGFLVPGDGRVNPVDLTTAFAKGARNLGVRVVEGARVTAVEVGQGRVPSVTGVRVGEQLIECEYVVNCAGMWARELAGQNGVVVPNQAAEHYYLITDTIEGLGPDTPVFEDPAAYGYFREEGGGMMVGLFEPEAAAWRVEGIPADFSFGTLPVDWDRITPFLQTAMERVPITLEAGVRTFFCGPESFTPDLAPAVGEAPQLRNYFVAAGLNSVGILSSGGLGRVVAAWIVDGRPDVDVTGFDVARFRAGQLEPERRRTRTAEVLGTVYSAHPPGKQLYTARDEIHSPVHDELLRLGGLMRDVSGWEGAAWFAGEGKVAEAVPTWGRAPWFEHWAAEHHAVRQQAGVFDMSFMGKISVRGPGSGGLLEYLSTSIINDVSGQITYTTWLDDGGRIVADLTVAKLGDEDFEVVTSDTTLNSVLGWLLRAAPDSVQVTDRTREQALFSVQGPDSRGLLAAVDGRGLPGGGPEYRGITEVTIGGVPVRATRVTYVGELGYELAVPADRARIVYGKLVGAGVRPVGLAALGSLRLEKTFRDYGHDIDNTDCPLETGLGFTLAWDKPFRGRDAVEQRRTENRTRGGMAQRLLSLRLTDPEPLLFHGEVVHRDGVPVGDVRSASYGWTVGAAVGLAFVTAESGGVVTTDWLAQGTWEVDVAGRRYPAEVGLKPWYDPAGERVR